MLNFHFKSIEKIRESKTAIKKFENHFQLTFPSAYKTFISNFDVAFEENYVLDSYVDSFLRLAPAISYTYFTHSFKEIGNIQFWDSSIYLELAIANNKIQEDFENEISFIENGYYAIGKYLNYHFILVGIHEDNHDKIYIYDSDYKESPEFAANDIFELLSFARKDEVSNKAYMKLMGEKYYTCIDKVWKVSTESINQILETSNKDNKFTLFESRLNEI